LIKLPSIYGFVEHAFAPGIEPPPPALNIGTSKQNSDLTSKITGDERSIKP